MKKHRSPFGLFLKKLACGQKVYYYTTYDSTGKRRQFSTGVRDEKMAMLFAMDRLKQGTLVPQESLRFGDWAEPFFDYDRCPHIQGRIQRGGTYSTYSAVLKRRQFLKNVLPYFQNYQLPQITLSEIEKWQKTLMSWANSHDKMNRLVGLLRIVLGEAERLQLIEESPMKRVRRYFHNPKERGVFTRGELRELFGVGARERVWSEWPLAFYAAKLAYLGGLRMGEILGLQVEDLTEDAIHLRHGWDRLGGLKAPKNGRARTIPLEPGFLYELKLLAPRKSGHVFSLLEGIKPVSPTYLGKALRLALVKIGLDLETQKERVLSFHSLRHTMVSDHLAQGVPPAVVGEIVGHRTLAMTVGLYGHPTEKHLELLRASQNALNPASP